MTVKAKRGPKILAPGSKAALHALRSLASLGQGEAKQSGDLYAILRSPSQWPAHVHEDIKDAWTVIAEGGFEVPGHVVAEALTALRGLRLVPGFKVRLPTSSDEAHPTFVRGTGKNPALLRMRDFVDTLVLTTEATLALDAAGSALGKGKPKLEEQRALRQHLGLPKNATASRARLRSQDVQSLFADAGLAVDPKTLTRLVAIIGSPYPDVPALVRNPKQPVPYLEAERLLLSALSEASLRRMLSHTSASEAAAASEAAIARARTRVAPPPWFDTYMRAALQANAGGWRAELAAALPSEAHVSSLERDELEAWWMGDAPLAQQPSGPMSGPSGAAEWASKPARGPYRGGWS